MTLDFVAQRDLASAVRPRVLEREPDDPPGAHDRDGFQRDAGVLAHLEAGEVPELPPQRGGLGRAAFELDALIEVFGVLAHDDDVRGGMTDRDARQGTGGAHGGEEVELLAERDVDAPEPGSDRGRDGTLDGHPAVTDRLERLLGQQRAVALERACAGDRIDPFDVTVSGVEDQPCGSRDLRPDAVSGDDRDAMNHRASLAARSSTPRPRQRAEITAMMCVPPSIAPGCAQLVDLPRQEPVPHRGILQPPFADLVVPDREEVRGRRGDQIARMSVQTLAQVRPTRTGATGVPMLEWFDGRSPVSRIASISSMPNSSISTAALPRNAWSDPCIDITPSSRWPAELRDPEQLVERLISAIHDVAQWTAVADDSVE